MLSAASRGARIIATLVVIGALFAGTFWGDDDNWPFGPFRMYSIRNRLDGRIKSARVDLTMSDGSKIETQINAGTFALRRAEVEGQVDRFESEPALLRHLASTYDELHPGGTEVVGVRLLYEMTQMEEGRPRGPVEEITVATWGAT